MGRLEKLSIIVYSHTFDRIHFALSAAAAAAATNIPATLFFTMGAIRALARDETGEPRWKELTHSEDEQNGLVWDNRHQTNGIAGFEELLQACGALEVKFLVCEMGLRAARLDEQTLRDDVPIEKGGLVTFLADAKVDGSMLFI